MGVEYTLSHFWSKKYDRKLSTGNFSGVDPSYTLNYVL